MNIIESIKNLFVKTEVEPGVITQPEQKEETLFCCHHCHHMFEVEPKDIFPTSVRLLYKDQYVTGKGVMCPNCKQNSIFG